MNEIAASLIYIYTKEALYREEVEKYEEATEEEINILLLFNSWEYAEPDIYTLFTALMNDAQHMEMFRPNYTEQQKIKLQSKKPSAILTRVAKLQDILLKQVDLPLFRHLKLLQVEFQIFLLKWIRCMFTRELSLIESFHAWDAIFQDFFVQQSDTLFFVDCIAIAMIIYLKNQLMETEESSQCYQRFLKFPKISNLSSLLDINTSIQIRNILISQKSANNLDDNIEGIEKIEKLINPAFFVSDQVQSDVKALQDKNKNREQPKQQSQIKSQQQQGKQNEEEQSQSPQSQIIIEKQPVKQQESQQVFFDEKIMQSNTKPQKSQFNVEEKVKQKESIQNNEEKQMGIKLSIKTVQDICVTIEEAFNIIKTSNDSQNHQDLIISLAELKQYLSKQINQVEEKQGNSQDENQKNKNSGFVIKKQITGQPLPQEDNGIKSKMAGFFKKNW